MIKISTKPYIEDGQTKQWPKSQSTNIQTKVIETLHRNTICLLCWFLFCSILKKLFLFPYLVQPVTLIAVY